jgi:hypothetical protein
MDPMINGLIPMANVSDVERSMRFYQQLGFDVQSSWKKDDGTMQWAHLRSVSAHIMFARSDTPVDKQAQGVLFYMYSPNLVGLRDHLLGLGVKVSAITYPFYMEKGEVQIDDPDGYCLLIGQAE